MALRNIFIEGEEILGQKAKEVGQVDEKIRQLLDDMRETMQAADGLGIAAPQVGILKRIFVIELDEQLIEMINPVIVSQEGSQIVEEGCLSVPGMVGTVERPAVIKMRGLDRQGKEFEIEGEDMLAVALSHEYDHLDGILYTEKATDLHFVLDDDENNQSSQGVPLD